MWWWGINGEEPVAEEIGDWSPTDEWCWRALQLGRSELSSSSEDEEEEPGFSVNDGGMIGAPSPFVSTIFSISDSAQM